MSDANVIGELVVRISGDFNSLQDAMRSATDVADKGKSRIASAMNQLRTGFNRLGAAALKWVSIAGGVVGSFLSIRGVINSLNSVDGLAKTADRLGMTTEALAGLRHAANITGVDVGGMETALQRLPRVLDQAIEGSGAAARAFRRLGLDASEIARLKPDQQMKVLADAISGVQGQTEQAAIAMELFGRSGSKMLNLLRQGSGGIQGLADEAAALGLAVSRVDAAKVEMANDAMTRFRASLEGITNRIAVALAPLINYLSDMFAGAAKNVIGMGDVFDFVVDAMVDGIGLVRAGWDGLTIMWHSARVAIGNLAVWTWTAVGAMVDAASWLVEKLSASWDVISSSAKVAWEGIRIGFDFFVASAQRGIASLLIAFQDLLMQMAIASTYLPEFADGAGDVLLQSANALTVAGMSLRKSANERMDAAGARLDESTAELNDAWARLTGAQDQQDQQAPSASALFIQEMIDGAKKFRTEAHNSFGDAYAAITENGESAVARNRAQFEQFRTEFDNHALYIAEQQALMIDHEISEEERRNMELGLRRQEFLDNMVQSERNAQEAVRFLWESGFKGKMQVASSFFNQIATLMNTESRKQFEIGKAAATAGAIVDTYLAATKAYQSMAGIPYVGPVLGAAAAAAAIAAGIANVRNIQATKFGQGGSASPSTPATPSVSAGGADGGSDSPTTAMNVTLQGDRFSGEQVRGLINAISDQLDDNAKLRLSTGG